MNDVTPKLEEWERFAKVTLQKQKADVEAQIAELMTKLEFDERSEEASVSAADEAIRELSLEAKQRD